MALNVILTGDLNMMQVGDPEVPFRRVAAELKAADVVFGNLESCLYEPPGGPDIDRERLREGFYADPKAGGETLRAGSVQAVGIANNVNYGTEAIKASVARLDALGIAHTGAGANSDAARAPAILERSGTRFGILQRTTVYWPMNHEATATDGGVATVKCHTAYQVPVGKMRADMQPANRPGIAPIILTWVDPVYRDRLREDIARLREEVDVVIVSYHWGLRHEILDYMTEIAHLSIDAGADLVMGHGPHVSLPIEIYKEKPIYYGLGSFCFHTGHGGKQHGDWVGLMARLEVEDRRIARTGFKLVRHNDANETYVTDPEREEATLRPLRERSAAMGAKFVARGEEIFVEPA
ncbi:CapA family protein [Amaricoccus solimangrovi]|uniref:CapA family protein n=1 Tax=Amaricoccus solimangrovi TaxID=2589815 RepID=A0A501WBZ1_9RHOB|nr:CapA family protein [Amaricoccus solimangrovi]TPE47119.1 CapA family protein [Amaricoccus solimangrovi]